MGRIHLVSDEEGIRYRVVAFSAGTQVFGPNMPMEGSTGLSIAIRLVGAEIEWKTFRVIHNPDPTDDYEDEAFLPCNASTTKALLASELGWDEEARRVADTFQVPLSDAADLQKECARLHREYRMNFSEWMRSSDRPPPVPPW